MLQHPLMRSKGLPILQMGCPDANRSKVPRRGVNLWIHGDGPRGGLQSEGQTVRGCDWRSYSPVDSREEGCVPVMGVRVISLNFLKSLPRDIQRRRLEKNSVDRGLIPFQLCGGKYRSE